MYIFIKSKLQNQKIVQVLTTTTLTDYIQKKQKNIFSHEIMTEK